MHICRQKWVCMSTVCVSKLWDLHHDLCLHIKDHILKCPSAIRIQIIAPEPSGDPEILDPSVSYILVFKLFVPETEHRWCILSLRYRIIDAKNCAHTSHGATVRCLSHSTGFGHPQNTGSCSNHSPGCIRRFLLFCFHGIALYRSTSSSAS